MKLIGLEAKIKVKEDKVSEYLELADKTDKAVEAAEPGMLHHTFDIRSCKINKNILRIHPITRL